MLARRAFSLLFWTFLVVSSLVLFPIAVVLWAITSPFDRRRALLHQFTCFWASLYTWLNPAWPVTIEDREHIRRDAVGRDKGHRLLFDPCGDSLNDSIRKARRQPRLHRRDMRVGRFN